MSRNNIVKKNGNIDWDYIGDTFDTINKDKVTKSYIYVDDFKQDNDIDDTNAIQSAIDYSYNSINKPIIMLSQRAYVTSNPIILRSYVVLCGGYANDEYKLKTTITNNNSDMFMLEDTTTIGYNLISICFIGNNNNQLFMQQDYTTYFHKWGKILHCGFKYFNSIFGSIQLVGFRIYDCFMNNMYQIGTIYGSDNYFQQWFVSHTEKNDIRYDFSLSMRCLVTVIRDIFFTGSLTVGNGPISILEIYGSNNYGVRVENCSFDYCDGSAIVCDSQSRNIVIEGNTFRGNLRKNTSTKYTGIIAFHTSHDVTVSNNSFLHTNSGNYENTTPIFYSFYGLTGYKARNIDIFGNHYEEDYVFNVDKNAEYRNINIKDIAIIYDNQKAFTISSLPSDTINVDYIDDVLNTYTSPYVLSNFSGNLYNGKTVTVYNFSSSTITFTEGNFRNKSVADLVLKGYSAVRYVYRSGKWWEI
jgi:hypothetical protein